MNKLTAREQRLLALGILAVLVAVVWLGAISPVLRGFALRRDMRERAEQDYARNARLIAAFPLGRLRADVLRADRESAATVLLAATPAAAAEAARARIVSAAAAEGGALQALRLQAPQPRRVRLQADLRISYVGLIRLLRRLQTDRPFATVDSLSVASAETVGGVAAVLPLEIRLEFTYAYR